MNKYENPWQYRGEIFESEMIGDNHGFVYLITNTLNNRKYIGKKFFWSRRRKPVKNKIRKKLVIKESDWKDYYGSCDELLEDIKILGKEHFKREILSLHKTKGDVNYNEAKQQFLREVLEKQLELGGIREYYNSNIMSRYFVKSTNRSSDVQKESKVDERGFVDTESSRKGIDKNSCNNSQKRRTKRSFKDNI